MKPKNLLESKPATMKQVAEITHLMSNGNISRGQAQWIVDKYESTFDMQSLFRRLVEMIRIDLASLPEDRPDVKSADNILAGVCKACSDVWQFAWPNLIVSGRQIAINDPVSKAEALKWLVLGISEMGNDCVPIIDMFKDLQPQNDLAISRVAAIKVEVLTLLYSHDNRQLYENTVKLFKIGDRRVQRKSFIEMVHVIIQLGRIAKMAHGLLTQFSGLAYTHGSSDYTDSLVVLDQGIVQLMYELVGEDTKPVESLQKHLQTTVGKVQGRIILRSMNSSENFNHQTLSDAVAELRGQQKQYALLELGTTLARCGYDEYLRQTLGLMEENWRARLIAKTTEYLQASLAEELVKSVNGVKFPEEKVEAQVSNAVGFDLRREIQAIEHFIEAFGWTGMFDPLRRANLRLIILQAIARRARRKIQR